MSQLRFEVLGPLRVTRGGREVELGPARRRAALAALLADAGRIVPVDALVDRVWDCAPPPNAQGSLQSYVSRLRAVLRDPDVATSDAEGSVLVTVPPGYRLDVGPEDLDALRLERDLGAARVLRAAGDAVAAKDLLDAALADWRGEPYADVTAAFVDAERIRWRARRDAARELRAQVALDLGEHESAVDDLMALVDDHPLREPLHAALMLALHRGGRTAEALQHYATAGARISDELGVDPGADLRDLHARILREDPSLTPRVSPAPAPVAGADADVRPAVRVEPVAPAAGTMVGRTAELARALATLDGTWATGTVGAVALVGEAGIGKSRLAEEIAARAGAGGATVVWSRTWQHGEAPVLWPWVQVVRRLAGVVGPDVTSRALAGRAAPLGALVPDLPGAVDAGSGPRDPASGADVQLPVFEAVEAFLREVATGRRVLVVLEDLHWADAASHRLLEYLVGHSDACPVAFVTAVRSPAESGGRGPDLLAALARSGRTTRIDLAGLDAADVRRYVADRTGDDLDDRTADALVERTGGNPFFVGELVALFADSDGAGGARTAVPTSVRDVVRQRVADLGDDTGQVLATASLMDRTFDLDLLAQVTRLGDDVVDEAVDQATAAGLLASEPGTPGAHRFTHALVAEALAETVGPARRQRLHARTADVLEQRLADGVVASGQLVHHLVETGDPRRIERAVELCCEAGARARNRQDLGEAEAVLLAAVELTARLAPGPRERWELVARNRLGALYVLLYGAHHPDAVAQRRRSQELLAGTGAAREVAILQAHRWAEAMMVADFRATQATIEEIAATAAAADDDLVRACAEAAAGEVLLHRGRPGEAWAHLDAACRLLRAAGPVPTDFAVALPSPPPAWVLWRDMARVLLGELDDLPAEAVEEALGEARRDLQLAAFVHGPIAVVACVRDDPAKALAPAEICVELAERAGLAHLGTYYRSMAGWARIRLAARPVPGAVEDMLADIGLFDGWPTMLMRPFHLGLCADALLSLDRPAEAAVLLDRAVEETVRTDNAQLLAETHRSRAVAWARLGRPEAEVVAELGVAAGVAADQGNVLFERRIARTAAELGFQLPVASSSSAASVREPVNDIGGLVTR